MTKRYGFRVDTLPNAVRRPASVAEPPGRARLLYVGNLTYGPNIDAVHDLITEELPRVRATVPHATVDVVGAHDARLADLAGDDGQHAEWDVQDLSRWFSGAVFVVVALRVGAGKRILVLEAFALRGPVVCRRRRRCSRKLRRPASHLAQRSFASRCPRRHPRSLVVREFGLGHHLPPAGRLVHPAERWRCRSEAPQPGGRGGDVYRTPGHRRR